MGMGYDYVALTCVALLLDCLVLIRVLMYGAKNKETLEIRFIRLIGITIIFGLIDTFWGFCYEDVFALGTLGIEVASAMYFGFSAIVSYYWFIYVIGLIRAKRISNTFRVFTFIPAAFVLGLCLANHWTQALYVIEDTCYSYHRGSWYVVEQFCTYGYFVVMLIVAFMGIIWSKNKVDKKKYFIISVFSFVPFIVGFLQIFTAILPYSSLAFTFALATICLFISAEKSELVLTKQIDDFNRRKHEFTYLKSLADSYLTLHIINIKENTVEELNSISYVRQYVNRNDDAKAQMESVMRNLVVEECLEDVLTFTDFSTLSERMKGNKTISQEFLGIFTGWFRAQFIAVSYDDNHNLEEVFFTTQIIDDEKKKEEALIEVSITDELTKLNNRHAYEKEIKDIKKNGISDDLVYVAMDLNGLKKVNDTLGHAKGDEYICGAAECMVNVMGEYGKVFRIGGDEFAAILYGADISKIIKKLTKRMQKFSFAYGFVSRNEFARASIEEISRIADERMYENKAKYYSEIRK